MNPESIFNILLSRPQYTLAISMGCDECYREFPCFEIHKSEQLALLAYTKYPTTKYINIESLDQAFILHLFDSEYLGSIKITRDEIVWLKGQALVQG